MLEKGKLIPVIDYLGHFRSNSSDKIDTTNRKNLFIAKFSL